MVDIPVSWGIKVPLKSFRQCTEKPLHYAVTSVQQIHCFLNYSLNAVFHVLMPQKGHIFVVTDETSAILWLTCTCARGGRHSLSPGRYSLVDMWELLIRYHRLLVQCYLPGYQHPLGSPGIGAEALSSKQT